MTTSDVMAAAEAWITGDPDPQTRAELRALIDAGDVQAVAARMGEGLAFGTAGIRGEVGAGSGRMNRAVVIRTTAGLASYLASERPDRGPIVVGYDGRPTSRTFAEDVVGVLAAAGFKVRYFDHPVPTPLVAYTGRRLGATASIVITASHNPPQDNGYKVYDANAAQIVPPVDSGIAAEIKLAPQAVQVPRVENVLETGHDAVAVVGLDLEDDYLADLTAIRHPAPAGSAMRIVYTPLHGVGRDLMVRAFRNAGFRDVHVVPEQAEPDGRFPTVAFPNPEEPGALDLAKSLADAEQADLILANDPDADRLAVCVPDPTGGWRALSGNQTGILLADYVLSTDHGAEQPIVASSIVSSPMLGPVAEAYGARWERTLTGFKWICNAALDLEAMGEGHFVFGYEEALGYTVGRVVRDKDGIGAAVWFADLVAHLRTEGESVLDRLEALYRRHGLWVSTQKAVIRPGPVGRDEIAAAMERLRDRRPETLGGRQVRAVTDYRDGAEGRPRWLGEQALVVFSLEGGSRVLVRPSGTEPKLKIYVDAAGELAPGAALAEAEAALLDEAGLAAADLAEFLGFA
jgi:phosphomannomutase